MDSPRPTIDQIQLCLAETVATNQERTPDEQRTLLAELLATAYEARRQPATI